MAMDYRKYLKEGFQLKEFSIRANGKDVGPIWASYDANSRMQNVLLSNAVAQMPEEVKMVSVSFDQHQSVFNETIKKDKIEPAFSFVELAGEKSPLYKQFRLKRGFKNYLLNPQGIIIAKDVKAEEIAAYVKKEAES